jgi:UDP-hydrolysing UDP-N-acetyl-D-glucosamine 2-epimerase
MTDARRVAVVTSTRADYGLLRWTMQSLQDDPRAQLQVIATGTHLSSAFGRTIDAIKGDGFDIDAEVDMPLDDSDGLASAEAAGLVMTGVARALRRLKPDVVLVLGDRFEILASVQAAYLGRIPVAHIHGGEVTVGAFDDGNRHAITKLARLHLTSTEDHRQRVMQLGEDPAWVHNVGAPGLETFQRIAADDRDTFERHIGIKGGNPAILLTYHPATAANEDPAASMQAIVDAIAAFPEASIIATGSNADPGGRLAMATLMAVAGQFDGRLVIRESLGQQHYVNALAYSDVVVGNSSSGIIEAPSAGIPTVNIGARQQGRPRAASVIDCEVSSAQIRDAIARAMEPSFRAVAGKRQNPYGGRDLGIGKTIANLLLGTDLTEMRAAKHFVDIPTANSNPAPGTRS